MRYIAFLRGINVGGHRVQMKELVTIGISAGLTNVKTVIASGNILFESDETNEALLTENLEKKLWETLGYEVKVMLRTIPYLQELVMSNPFKHIQVDDTMKLYVTFLGKPLQQHSATHMKSEEHGFEVIEISNKEVYIVAYKLPTGRYGDLLLLDSMLGKHVTMRNWNTVVKIANT